MDAGVFESNHTIADLRCVYVNINLSSERQRSFTYIIDHGRLGALLELEQNDVYDRHLERFDKDGVNRYVSLRRQIPR
jgi:hypothetical protein